MSLWTMIRLDQRSWKELSNAESVVRIVEERPAAPEDMAPSAMTWNRREAESWTVANPRAGCQRTASSQRLNTLRRDQHDSIH
jgi:hypothetical protein